MSTLAEELILSLKKLGVHYVFGIPGGPSIPYMEAMRKHNMEFVLTANEQSAAIMAGMFGVLTGTPGVCHATFGPGATNLATGVGGALLDRLPLIALTTEVSDSDIGRKVQMNIDHQALYRPISKQTFRMSPDNYGEILQTAFALATEELPGSVHIGLPTGIERCSVEECGEFMTKRKSALPDDVLLSAAINMLAAAKKPLIAIGLTAVRHNLTAKIRALIEKLNIPVVVTPMAKGIVADDHACFAGVLFHAQSEHVAEIYRQADLVVGIGYDSVEFNYEAWMPKVPLIHMDTDEVDITPEYGDVLSIKGDLAASIEYLSKHDYPHYAWNLDEVAAMKRRLYDDLTAPQDGFTPSQLVTEMQAALPQNHYVVSDVGAHLHLLGQLFKTDEPNRFIITNGWSAMGFGIPAAIGIKLCRPDSKVVCVTGDGGFLMNCGELLTARRLGINIVVVVMCDRSLSLIELKQKRQNVVAYGTDLYEGEFFGAEKFLGVPIITVDSADAVKAAFEQAFAKHEPVIIAANIDGSSYNDLVSKTYK